MDGFNGKAFGAEIVTVVKEYLAREIGGVSKRLDDIEQRLASLPVPKDGKDADEDAVVARVSQKMTSELEGLRAVVNAIQVPEFPQVPELPDIGKMIDDAVSPLKIQMQQGEEVFRSLKDSIEISVSDLAPIVPTEEMIREVIGLSISEAITAMPEPKDGKDGTSVSAEDVMPALEKRVEEFLSAIPTPKDGTSVTIDDVAPIVASEVEKRVSGLPRPKDGRDGLDVKEMFRAEGGKLVAVMSDGTTRDLGVFVGKDGQDADMAAIEKTIMEKIDAIPRPKDGKDGFSLKHFDADLLEDGRTVVLKFQDGSDTGYSVELGIPAMIYRGVFKEGQTYEKGDTVTWGGCLWHCDEVETTSKPDGAEKHWTLAAKKGRDGRDGEVKAAKAPAKVKI